MRMDGGRVFSSFWVQSEAMSLKDFKQTLLQSANLLKGEDERGEEKQKQERWQKRPPKGSLRAQIASVQDLHKTSLGLVPCSIAQIEAPAETLIRPLKRIRGSETLGLVPEVVVEKEKEIEGGGEEEESKKIVEQSMVEIERDSEAGMFIQSQSEGLQEPLILSSQNNAEGTELVQVPSSINSRLMEHQREGVKFLYRLYRENKGGVLGDDMGLGKTIQVLAFLAAVLKSYHSGQTMIKERDRCHRKQVLIICPTSVLRNWEQEFHAWGTFDVAIYHGVHRDSVLNKLESGSLQIVLTSFDTFRIHGDCLLAIGWDCMVVDEAHRLKNEKSELYKACMRIGTKRRYGLTGTIMQNKMMDLFNVFDWAAPGCLGTREHFREFYDEPLKQGQRISAPERFVIIADERRLHLARVLKKYLLRREKHDTIGHLMMGKEDNVIFCKMSSLQRKVYKRLLASPDFQSLINKDKPCTCGSPLMYAECCYRMVPDGIIWSYLHKESVDGCDSCPYCMVLPCLTKLQQVSNHLELIKPNPKDDPEKQKKDQMLAELVFGEDASLIGGVSQDESFLGLSDSQHCGKMRALDLLLAHWLQQGDKVLLFSYSVRMLDILDKFLIRKGYCFSRLDGSTAMSMRQSLVDEFNRSPSKQVFLISTRAGGLGLNLVSANRVVIFDPNWNPAQDLQAQDRSFRFGQRRHVIVYRLLAAGSLEELVYSRQIYKQQLFNIAVSGNLEKRYFDGVQDSKDNKGELFGISNLFRDLSEEAFTSEIIEEHDKRILSYASNGNRARNDKGLTISQRRNARALDGTDSSGKLSQPCKNQAAQKNKVASVLRNAGVVYAHRNEDVVNYMSKAKYDGVSPNSKQKSEQQMVCLEEENSSRVIFDGLEEENPCVKNDHAKLKAGLDKVGKGKPLSKEDQFASLASFKGMDKTRFSRWLLSASEAEKQELLFNFKQRKKV